MNVENKNEAYFQTARVDAKTMLGKETREGKEITPKEREAATKKVISMLKNIEDAKTFAAVKEVLEDELEEMRGGGNLINDPKFLGIIRKLRLGFIESAQKSGQGGLGLSEDDFSAISKEIDDWLIGEGGGGPSDNGGVEIKRKSPDPHEPPEPTPGEPRPDPIPPTDDFDFEPPPPKNPEYGRRNEVLNSLIVGERESKGSQYYATFDTKGTLSAHSGEYSNSLNTELNSVSDGSVAILREFTTEEKDSEALAITYKIMRTLKSKDEAKQKVLTAPGKNNREIAWMNVFTNAADLAYSKELSEGERTDCKEKVKTVFHFILESIKKSDMYQKYLKGEADLTDVYKELLREDNQLGINKKDKNGKKIHGEFISRIDFVAKVLDSIKERHAGKKDIKKSGWNLPEGSYLIRVPVDAGLVGSSRGNSAVLNKVSDRLRTI